MVVAAGAPHGKADECLAGRVDDIVKLVETIDRKVRWLVIPGSEAIEASCDDGICCRVLKLIPGQLFGEEAVKRFIRIQ